MSTQDVPDGRKDIQKRTFTRWVNVYLSRHDPPAEVCDLFQDIQDGRMLMMLLEELTGCKLLYRFRSSSHRIFRLNNISKALAFLDDRHVKLLGIDASALADGIPSVVLNLIWNIILHFQVKEMTGGLHRRLSSSLSSLSIGSELTDESVPDPGRNTAKGPKYSGKTIKSLLHWVQRCTVKFGVEVHDFGRSWRNGLAFLALIKSLNPDLVDLRLSLTKDPEENLEQAFRLSHHHLDVPPLLEPQDVTCRCPDEKSIITYVSMFLRHCPDMVEDLSTAVSSPNMSKFRSLETLADREEAPPVFSSLETSHELLLWKRWARRASNSASQNKRKSSSALQPPSPLDANVANPDIRSWLVKSSDHGYSKTKNNEIRFSLSSEEGIYSLTPLDSDEEDAYSYILGLNNDVSQAQAKRQVPRVEEESEDISLIDEMEQEMFGFSGDAESEGHIHDKDLNGNCKEKFADTKQEIIKEMQNVAKERLPKKSLGLKSENVIDLLPQKIMDLEEGRTERKAQLKTGYSKKDDLYSKDIKTNNQLQALNVSMVQKSHEDQESRNIRKSDISMDSFIENLTKDMSKAKDNNEFNELMQREKVEDEAGPSIESKRVSGDASVSGGKNIPHYKTFNSPKKYQEVSESKCNHEATITASESGVLVKYVVPSGGLNRTELQVMLLLWMLLYCYFLGQQVISY